MSFIKININNSFNKERSQQQEKIITNEFTLNSNNPSCRIEVNSINATSLTNSAINGQLNIAGNGKRKTIIREIFIAASGTIIGSIITYLILGIK
ncbi:MAG: hypothetical protein COX36_00105 [Candidatus Nealsonbacteria bacterium CG23_combo_of_CG06-09_8_20_14_all_38_19]|uniref:Uncharacterized protein n=1 Tax=Candidatus Nealsonbacteria bacterium CG23_combo_of_CG06-09_8_20_14_all_38_19 TaxID=1974721 RepID=A0A2G9YXP4_9BACT|nr:MAG: hypothetical protein COX36_00105 [Candidatus Nealsonbacteria bacterium CG23_combo_of_CG06-09_8_20_14_all_38_19]